MIFEALDFKNFNETDVREEIIAPLIRYLGYRSGTLHEVIREQSLRYPKASMGRKKPNSDPVLRGKADYILEAGGSVRWIIEAKAPDVEIDTDAIEQAFTYANHPEVRAVFFMLSNGKEFVVYQTNQGPDQSPVLEFCYDAIDEKLSVLQNLVGPEALLRDHPSIVPDLGKPLGPGLRSIARIANGLIKYEENSLRNSILCELQTGIPGGAVERNDAGKMVAFLKTHGPTQSLQDLNERLGLTSFEMLSNDKEISTHPGRPTEFLYDRTITLPQGEEILDINTWSKIRLPVNISCHVIATAQGILNNKVFSGKFTTQMNFLNPRIEINMTGTFEIYLA